MHLFCKWHSEGRNEPFKKETFCGKIISGFNRTVDPYPVGNQTFTSGTVCDECEEAYHLYLLSRVP